MQQKPTISCFLNRIETPFNVSSFNTNLTCEQHTKIIIEHKLLLNTNALITAYIIWSLIMKLMLPLLLMFFVTHANSVNIYIDPDCAINGNGSTQNCFDGINGPQNSWVGITYLPGNSYLGKGGKTTYYDQCNFLIKASGNSYSNQIIIGSYGTGKHSIVCENGYVFGETQRAWITINNIDLTAITNHCILLQGSNNISIKNVIFRYCASNAIGLDGGNSWVDHDKLSISQNTFLRTGSSAISGSPSLLNDQDWSDNRITGNLFESGVSSGGTEGTPAISLVQISNNGVGVNNKITNLQIDNNTFHGINYEREHPSFLILVSRSPFPANPLVSTDHSNCVRQTSVFGLYIHDNTATNIGGGIGVHFSTNSNIARNRLTNFRASSVIGLFYSDNMYTGENIIDKINTGPFAGYWDGIGIDYDFCTRNGIIARNHISNAYGSDQANADWNGQAIAIFAADSHKIYANVLVNNRFGVVFGDDNLIQNYGPNELYNNTIVNSLRDGISTRFTTEQENYIYNNIIAYSGRYGLRADGSGEQHLTNNLFFGNASANIVSNGSGKGTILSNPLFVGGGTVNAYRIRTSSPTYRAGTPINWPYLDYSGRIRPVPQSIGAFEPTQN